MNNSLGHSVALVIDPLLLAGAIIVIGFGVTRYAFKGRPIGKFTCHLAFFIGLTAALFLAHVVPYVPTSTADTRTKFIVESLFKIVWWVAASRLLAGFVRAFMILETQPKETRLLQDLIVGVIYLAACVGIVSYVFDMPVGALFATSGAVAIILGLALQSTLSDVFSGIVLNFAKPYRPGDWVIFDADTQGTIIEMNWRATQIVTASNDLAILPNSTIAKAKLINLGHPTKIHGMSIRLGIASTTPPSAICEMLQVALLSSNRILHMPRPTVTITAVNSISTDCELYFFVPDMATGIDARNEIFDLVYRQCAAFGIRLAPPPGSPVMPTVQAVEPGTQDKPHGLLDRLPIFATLTDDERASLSAKLRRRPYGAGETVVEIDSPQQVLSIVAWGVLVASRKEGEREVELVRMGPGDCFGVAGVLTGAVAAARISTLTKAVLYQLSRDDLAPVLKAQPSIATELSQNLARHEAVYPEPLEQHVGDVADGDDLAQWLVQRTKTLFCSS